MDKEKRWFISDEKEVRWVHTFITKDEKFDDGTIHLVVSMENELNQPCRPDDVAIESVDINDFFHTEKEAQLEIIRQERFDK